MLNGFSFGVSWRNTKKVLSGFIPTDIEGGILWLRADLGITTAGGEVTLWEDQSGIGDSGRNFAPPGTDKPAFNASESNYNNQPTIGTFSKFGLANDCRLTSGTWNTTYNQFSIFIIGHSPDAVNRIYTYESDSDLLSIRTGGAGSPTQLAIYTGAFSGSAYHYPFYSSYSDIGAFSESSPNVIGGFFSSSGSGSKGYANNLVTPDFISPGTYATFTPSTLGDNPLHIGCGNSTFSSISYGVERIAEIIMYDRALTSIELEQLRVYFNDRYGAIIDDVTPIQILGSRLKAYFADNYSAGTWTDDVGGALMTQATSGFRPTASTLPSGALDLSFDGVDDRLFGQWSTTNPTGGYRLTFFIGSLNSASTSRHYWLRAGTGFNQGIGVDLLSAGATSLQFQSSNGTVYNAGGSYRDNTHHRIIYIENVSENTAFCSVDGSALTSAIGASVASDAGWNVADSRFGTNITDVNRLFGTLARVGFAQSASPFTQDDVDALNAYLANQL